MVAAFQRLHLNGVCLNWKTARGESLLQWAIRLNLFRVADFLLDKIDDINLPDANGNTPLTDSIKTAPGAYEFAVKLLQIPEIEVNKNINFNLTPLKKCAEFDTLLPFAQLLCAHPNIKLKALGFTKSRKCLRQSALHHAANNGSVEVIKLLVQKDKQRSTLSLLDINGRTPLVCALLAEQWDAARILIKLMRPVEFKEGVSPLVIAKKAQNDEMVQLITSKMEPEKPSTSNTTPAVQYSAMPSMSMSHLPFPSSMMLSNNFPSPGYGSPSVYPSIPRNYPSYSTPLQESHYPSQPSSSYVSIPRQTSHVTHQQTPVSIRRQPSIQIPPPPTVSFPHQVSDLPQQQFYSQPSGQIEFNSMTYPSNSVNSYPPAPNYYNYQDNYIQAQNYATTEMPAQPMQMSQGYVDPYGASSSHYVANYQQTFAPQGYPPHEYASIPPQMEPNLTPQLYEYTDSSGYGTSPESYLLDQTFNNNINNVQYYG